jgi:hypothetical protein
MVSPAGMENPATVDMPPLPATVLWYQTLSRLFSSLRHSCASLTFCIPGPAFAVTDPLTHN